MTPGEEINLRDYLREKFDDIDRRFDETRHEIERSRRELGHRLDEAQDANSREHARVTATVGDAAQRSAAHETRLDLLEAERDKQIGAQQVAAELKADRTWQLDKWTALAIAVAAAVVAAAAGRLIG